jgi:hypothetical protein
MCCCKRCEGYGEEVTGGERCVIRRFTICTAHSVIFRRSGTRKQGGDIHTVYIRKNSCHGKSEGKKSFGRPRHRHEDNIKTNPTETV